jgi:hypothetical protein
LLYFSDANLELLHVEHRYASDHLDAVALHVRFGFDQELRFFPFRGADDEIARQGRTPRDHPEEPPFRGFLKCKIGHGLTIGPPGSGRKPENWSLS